jgi:starch synthase
MADLAVLSVASEVFPLVKTGGLADVVGALPAALAHEDIAVRTLVPGYPAVVGALEAPVVAQRYDEFFGGPARLLASRTGSLDLLVLDAPHLYARPGNPYLGPDGKDWPDNALRFAALSHAAVAVARGAIEGYVPDVLNAHDWQAGLAPALLHYGEGPRPATVMTLHNLAFQGVFPHALLARIGLPPHAWSIDGVEYYGAISYLKAGLGLADRITTVSPTYAEEIRTPESGMGFDGLLRARAAVSCGIVNGIDESVWDPSNDDHLAATFDPRRLRQRADNKAALQAVYGLDARPDVPLFAVVSRLTWQKGMDLLAAALPMLAARDAQFVLLGGGDRPLEAAFLAAAAQSPGRVGVRIGYDELLAHLVQGGADAVLVPSRFEPCGLTQLCALRYGAIPIVSRVGGLNDTVIDANEAALAAGVATGVQFAPVTREALEHAIDRALVLWRDRDAWHRLQLAAMGSDVGWTRPARKYAALYRSLASAVL